MTPFVGMGVLFVAVGLYTIPLWIVILLIVRFICVR